MKKIIAAICFIFALAPLAQAQDKAAPAAEKKAAPAAEKKAAATGEKKAAKKAKKEPTEKQKAQRAKMKSCSADAKDKNLKGGDRKKFMSSCLKG
jgi:psiF repeat